ncbi:hypothetical protein FB451DRAFT_1218904 [Mycena latifolia]|nr:hypothetical protein FB451DRAFT_1218904 [Mycena latifolia]
MSSPAPLDAHHVLTILHYIAPTIQPLPPHLVASQLAFRQSCLKLTPDDPAYLFWPSDDDEHVADAFESLQRRPIDDIPLDFCIRYTFDDTLCAHAELAAAGLRLPNDRDSGEQEQTPDSYWDSYGEPDREGAAAEFEQEQPGTTGSYWDMYSSVQGSGDSAIPSPAPEKQRHELQPIPYSYADMHPGTDPMESLSDRLEALSQRPPAPDEETPAADEETVVESPPVINETWEKDGLKESIRGVYRLWRSTQATSTPTDSKEIFMGIVSEVLAEP